MSVAGLVAEKVLVTIPAKKLLRWVNDSLMLFESTFSLELFTALYARERSIEFRIRFLMHLQATYQ